jgi:hypothetical protein
MSPNDRIPTARSFSLTRRRLLQAGALGAFGLDLAGLLRAEAAKPAATVRSCIVLFYYGGPSCHDTWDMKPDAPREVRGEFGSIATNVPGLRVCEHLPHSARVMDRLALVRSMHHPMTNHNAAAVEALCGRTPLKGDLELLANDVATDFPCYGAAMNYLLPRHGDIPTSIALPHVMYNVVMLPGQTSGFLGARYNPLQVARDPNAPDFGLGGLELPGELTQRRLEDRRSLAKVVDAQLRAGDRSAGAAGLRDIYDEQAFTLLRSQAVRRGFNLESEDPRVRDRYGRTKLGQSLLLARRLIEADVRFVSVYDKIYNGQLANWDSHQDNFPRLKDDLLPPSDRAFSALIEDLEARGLLASTLVVAMGEFGRTPRINPAGGRDHWPFCYTVVLAGGGIQGGLTHGTSDKIGAYPDADAVTPGDLAATLYWRFGIDPATTIHDGFGRGYRLAEGEPLQRLFA